MSMDMKIDHGMWVVVCDGAKALVLENSGNRKTPNLNPGHRQRLLAVVYCPKFLAEKEDATALPCSTPGFSPAIFSKRVAVPTEF